MRPSMGSASALTPSPWNSPATPTLSPRSPSRRMRLPPSILTSSRPPAASPSLRRPRVRQSSLTASTPARRRTPSWRTSRPVTTSSPWSSTATPTLRQPWPSSMTEPSWPPSPWPNPPGASSSPRRPTAPGSSSTAQTPAKWLTPIWRTSRSAPIPSGWNLTATWRRRRPWPSPRERPRRSTSPLMLRRSPSSPAGTSSRPRSGSPTARTPSRSSTAWTPTGARCCTTTEPASGKTWVERMRSGRLTGSGSTQTAPMRSHCPSPPLRPPHRPQNISMQAGTRSGSPIPSPNRRSPRSDRSRRPGQTSSAGRRENRPTTTRSFAARPASTVRCGNSLPSRVTGSTWTMQIPSLPSGRDDEIPACDDSDPPPGPHDRDRGRRGRTSHVSPRSLGWRDDRRFPGTRRDRDHRTDRGDGMRFDHDDKNRGVRQFQSTWRGPPGGQWDRRSGRGDDHLPDQRTDCTGDGDLRAGQHDPPGPLRCQRKHAPWHRRWGIVRVFPGPCWDLCPDGSRRAGVPPPLGNRWGQQARDGRDRRRCRFPDRRRGDACPRRRREPARRSDHSTRHRRASPGPAGGDDRVCPRLRAGRRHIRPAGHPHLHALRGGMGEDQWFRHPAGDVV